MTRTVWKRHKTEACCLLFNLKVTDVIYSVRALAILGRLECGLDMSGSRHDFTYLAQSEYSSAAHLNIGFIVFHYFKKAMAN